LLVFSLIGLVHQANAWERYTPQDWLANNVVRCYNTSNAICLSGAGKTPEVGQPCTIWNRDGSHSEGIVVRVNSDPGSNDNEEPSAPILSEFEVISYSEERIFD
jgi:hypothetical protein